MGAGRFEIVRTDAGYHVRTVAGNGELLATSETLTTFVAAAANVGAQVCVALQGAIWTRVDERTQGASDE